MLFSFSLSDFSLLLAVIAIVLFITTEVIYATPGNAARFIIDKSSLRLVALGCGLAFLFTVVMRIMGYL